VVVLLVASLMAFAAATALLVRERRRCAAAASALARCEREQAALAAALEQAQATAASLTGALEALPLGVAVLDGGGRVVARNESARSLTGSRDGLAAQAVAELVASARSGGALARTVELYGPPRRTLSLSAAVVDPGAGTVAVVIEDVSDRRRLDAVRRDFVANVSHELKTPVAALGLLAETLVAEDELPVVRRLAERMVTEAFRVARIIEDLLDLSRLESEHAVGTERVGLVEVMAQAADQVRAAASVAGVELDVAEAPANWAVRGERRQLVSAVANLLENAVKYSDRGSKVTLSAGTDGQCYELSVEDHGIGIPSRDLDRVFERFYRVDRGRGRDTGGTGLGLAIVRHVATNHGGEVTVSSHEGEGSVFTLRLPAPLGPIGLLADAG
jgi:two-component system, OmpR family, sensor histidine kinase SenX3